MYCANCAGSALAGARGSGCRRDASFCEKAELGPEYVNRPLADAEAELGVGEDPRWLDAGREMFGVTLSRPVSLGVVG